MQQALTAALPEIAGGRGQASGPDPDRRRGRSAGHGGEVMTELGLVRHRAGRRGQRRGAQAGHGTIVTPDVEKPLQLPPDSPALHLIQQVRDEAHRFAITGHRARRGKDAYGFVAGRYRRGRRETRRNLLTRLRRIEGCATSQRRRIGASGGHQPRAGRKNLPATSLN